MPIVVMQRRTEVKCYGALFTCMAIRAIHIEVDFKLNTDSFILALRRLIAKGGNVRSIYSNNGSNFIGAERELRKAYFEMDGTRLLHGGYWWKLDKMT